MIFWYGFTFGVFSAVIVSLVVTLALLHMARIEEGRP